MSALSIPESPAARPEALELPEVGGVEPRSLDELLAALEAEIAADPERAEARVQPVERVAHVEASPVAQFAAEAVEMQVEELMAELQPSPEPDGELRRDPERDLTLAGVPAGGSDAEPARTAAVVAHSDFGATLAESEHPEPAVGTAGTGPDSVPVASTPAAGQMIVDFSDVVGGAPEASFAREGLHAQPLGPGVFSTLETWEDSRVEGAGHVEPADAPPVAIPPLDAPVGFPTPSIFLQTIAGTLTPQRMGEGLGTRGGDPGSWNPVPETPALRQIVEAHVAAGGDGATIAAALERVAERVRRGEIRVPAGAADGEAAALAVALAALLQPGRQ